MKIIVFKKKNVKMRARTTSQIDWWHAQLTSLASAVTLYVVNLTFSMNHLGCKIIEM